MDEPEREYLEQQIQQLERSKGRWKLATITLAAVLATLLTVSGASSFLLIQRQTVMLQQALAEREMARAQAEQAVHQLRQMERKGEGVKER
jgi:hypothetical protein